MGLCRDILLRLPAAGEPPTLDGKTPTNNAQDSNKKDKKDKEKEKVSEDKDKNSAKPEKKGNNAAKTCYHCQKVGHVQTDCWSKFPEKRPTSRGGEKVYSTGQTGKDTWVLDSGSGAHATPCKDLISIVPQKVNVILEMADGSTAPATAIGKVDIPVEGANLPLQDVRYVPKLEVNLMSFGKLVRQGYTYKQLTYGNTHSILLTSPDKMFSFTANLSDKDIYVLEKPPTVRDLIRFAMPNGEFEPANILRPAEGKEDPLLALPKKDVKIIEHTMLQWHQKLGHLNPADIAKLAADPRLGMRIKGGRALPFCKTCVQAKMARPTFAPMTRTVKPAMRFFVDLAGGGRTLYDEANLPTQGGANYWMGITDDATRYRWIILMMSKGEATARLMIFIDGIEATTQRRIGTLHWDGGGEFKSDELKTYCQRKGIAYEITTPDTPQSNGPAERANRIVGEKTRSLLFDSGLARELWGEAIQAAVMMINTSPTSTKIYGCQGGTPLSPFEAWTGVQPSAHWIRRWGCKVYKKDLKVTNKLADRTDGKEWRLVGYQGLHQYRIWDPATRKLEIAKDVEEDKLYLGMEVKRQKNGDLAVTQSRYIDEILEDFGMDKVNPAGTPMAAGIRLEFSPDEDGGLDDEFTHTRYRQGLGSLQYLVTSSRPDLAFAVNYLSRFNSRPNKDCWAAFKHVLRYVKKTKKMGILYRKEIGKDGLNPVAYCDSDWAGADPQFKSTSGYVIMINGSPISWRSQRQTSTAKSTTEAEYIAASEAACELVWLNDMLYDAGLLEGKGKICSNLQVDNKGAIDLAKGESLTRRSRHIEIRYHILRELVEKDEIELLHVGSTANKADGFTKPLAKPAFVDFVEKLGLAEIN
ncbi:predicted protein [Histoplasma mississippiense (nom. inval.)]|uniref:predicted protein n=1 Tax=Ajellomyces capsulatus (strain NAm1 / WU24) TaxID=2059318 RepID=UPI000157B828|nr:predicted protein [Histoplasma mississippiense (nom. inval.)]EDN03936.1 predicted protein [Histoplasma mississippiense (nom. inval.)]